MSIQTRCNTFLMYNECLFDWEDQIRLKNYCKSLLEMKVRFILTNLYHKDVYDLFAGDLQLNHKIVERYSRIGAMASDRGNVKEYIFTNINEDIITKCITHDQSHKLKIAI